MRSSQKPNRSRGKSNRKNVGNNVNRVYESSGPEGKVRGTPQQIIDKYNALARDAQTSGDRVAAENFLQHAEHYSRLLTAAQAASNERREQNNAQQAQQANNTQPQNQPQPQVSQEQPQATPQAQQNGAQPPAETSALQPDAEPAPQPSDVNGMATFDGGESTQIVETPESERKKPTRTRKPRAPKNGAAKPAADASAVDAAAPEANPAGGDAEKPVEKPAAAQDASPEGA